MLVVLCRLMVSVALKKYQPQRQKRDYQSRRVMRMVLTDDNEQEDQKPAASLRVPVVELPLAASEL